MVIALTMTAMATIALFLSPQVPLMLAKGYRLGLGVDENSAAVIRGDEVEIHRRLARSGLPYGT